MDQGRGGGVGKAGVEVRFWKADRGVTGSKGMSLAWNRKKRTRSCSKKTGSNWETWS